MDKIIERITILEKNLVTPQGLAQPMVLSENIVKIAILISQLVDPLSEAELEFKQKRAREYHRLRESFATTTARDEIKMDEKLIRQEIEIDKVKNFIKRTEQILSTIQSHIKVKESEARSNL